MKLNMREIEREIENAGEMPGSAESGLSSQKVVSDFEKPVRYSRRNNYHGKKGTYDETE